MSGIATMTNSLVKKIHLINPRIDLYATRKTAPGLRYFDKEAVKIGGGKKHRITLNESVMIKDNHIAVDGSISNLIKKALKKYRIIEVEVDNPQNAIVAAKLGAKITRLDNFTKKEIEQTVQRLRNQGLRNDVMIEVSGGINTKNIQSFARTDVDYLSMGEITNSVRGIDFSLEVT